jgi:glycosyltransferase involved in cell wall biosynthesis
MQLHIRTDFMGKKILIIPSWYPNEENYLIGSFFQEQALLMHHNGFDVKILYGKISEINYIKFIKYRLKNVIIPLKFILKKNYLIQEPEAFSFPVMQFKGSTEEKKMRILYSSYTNALSELIGSGWKPDLIHAQCSVDAGIVANYLSNSFKIPFVIIEHQVFLLNYYSKFKQTLIINSFKNASKVGAVSNHQKRCILMNSIKCDPVILWNFVDETKFRIDSVKSDSKFRILTITYPNFIKDVETFFKSIASFCQMCNDDIEVVIIGNNSFENLNSANTIIFEDLAKKYNLFSKCKLIPFLSRNGISEILNTADVYISTSIAETFGVAVREAMLCGIPVITTKSGGVEDGINEKTGVTVNIGDFETIAKSLLKIKNKELSFDSFYIRDFTIMQCGKKSFLNKMTLFYS